MPRAALDRAVGPFSRSTSLRDTAVSTNTNTNTNTDTSSPAPPVAEMVNCPGCGGRNPAQAGECDWCGRQFVSRGRRLRLTIWQMLSTALVLALIGAVVLLALMNAGRTLPAPRLAAPTAQPAIASSQPTLAVTPRVTAAPPPATSGSGSSSGPAAAATESAAPPTAAPAVAQEPTATPTPELATARIANTGGQGVMVRAQPGPQAAAVGALREGAAVVLTGNDQTVAARTWREVETEDHRVKGWVLADYLAS